MGDPETTDPPSEEGSPVDVVKTAVRQSKKKRKWKPRKRKKMQKTKMDPKTLEELLPEVVPSAVVGEGIETKRVKLSLTTGRWSRSRMVIDCLPVRLSSCRPRRPRRWSEEAPARCNSEEECMKRECIIPSPNAPVASYATEYRALDEQEKQAMDAIKGQGQEFLDFVERLSDSREYSSGKIQKMVQAGR